MGALGLELRITIIPKDKTMSKNKPPVKTGAEGTRAKNVKSVCPRCQYSGEHSVKAGVVDVVCEKCGKVYQLA
jgi:hypothetical protein